MRSLPILSALALVLFSGQLLPGQSLLYELQGGLQEPSLGTDAARLTDIDADGVPDFATAFVRAGPGSGFTIVTQYRAGVDGALIHEVNLGPAASPSTSLAFEVVGDVNADGTPDLAVGVSAGAFASGGVYLIDGVDGTSIRTLVSPTVNTFGYAVAGVGDVNGDAVPDIAVGAPYGTSGLVQVFSGVDGTPILPATGYGTFGARTGECLSVLGDVNNDGMAEMLVGSPADNPGLGAIPSGYVRVVTAATGQVVTTLSGPSGTRYFGASVVRLDDLNGDGLPDFAVGAPQNDFGYPANHLWVFTTGSTAPLWSLGQPLVYDDAFRLAALNDLDGDGLQEIVASNGISSTAMHIVSGASGSLISTIPVPAATFWGSLATLGDVSGDGSQDFVWGDGGLGLLRLYSSRDASAQVTILGGSAGPGPLFPVLAATVPVLGTVSTLSITYANPLATGTLAIAPGPPNPFPIYPGFVIYPGISVLGSWALVPVTASSSGYWSVPVPIPDDLRLVHREAVLQAWFPSPLGLTGTSITNGLLLRPGY